MSSDKTYTNAAFVMDEFRKALQAEDGARELWIKKRLLNRDPPEQPTVFEFELMQMSDESLRKNLDDCATIRRVMKHLVDFHVENV